MWSVPYDYNTYNAYLAVGIANEFLNSSSLFNELYYHTGPFQRVKAGNLAEYSAPELKGSSCSNESKYLLWPLFLSRSSTKIKINFVISIGKECLHITS